MYDVRNDRVHRYDFPQDSRKGGVQSTCSCPPGRYDPSLVYDYQNLPVFFCRQCGHFLSTFQTDCYTVSEQYRQRVTEIEEQREGRKRQAIEDGERIYDEVR
jgi:hypothetical protein